MFKEIDLYEKKGTGIPEILRELKQNGSPEPEFDMDEERTYLNAIIRIRDGFEREEKISESMSELERARMQIVLLYLETNSSAAAKLLEVEIKTASRLRAAEELCAYDTNQGARIQFPSEITEKMAVMFYSRFWGRQDVYAKRNEKKDTGESSYFPQCNNFWTESCYRKRKQNISCSDCKYRSYKKLTKEDILKHLCGLSYNASDVIGVYPLLPDGTCRFLVFDFDNHEKGAEKNDFA